MMSKLMIIPVILILIVTGIITVYVAGCGNDEFIEAGFAANSTIAQAPMTVHFTDQSRGHIDSWEWDLNGDGQVDSVLQNPTYTYDIPGNYTVSLKVDSSDGSDTTVKTEYIIATSVPCQADFVAEMIQVEGREPIKFFDRSIGNIISWQWDFDNDGIPDATVPNPTHTYIKDGVYTVVLTVATANCQDTMTKQDYITVTGCKK